MPSQATTRLRSAILSLPVSVTTRQVISVDQEHHQIAAWVSAWRTALKSLRNGTVISGQTVVGPFGSKDHFPMVRVLTCRTRAQCRGADEPIPGLVGRAEVTVQDGAFLYPRPTHRTFWKAGSPLAGGANKTAPAMPAGDAGSADHRNFFNTKLISTYFADFAATGHPTCWRPATCLFWHAPLLRL